MFIIIQYKFMFRCFNKQLWLIYLRVHDLLKPLRILLLQSSKLLGIHGHPAHADLLLNPVLLLLYRLRVLVLNLLIVNLLMCLSLYEVWIILYSFQLLQLLGVVIKHLFSQLRSVS